MNLSIKPTIELLGINDKRETHKQYLHLASIFLQI